MTLASLLPYLLVAALVLAVVVWRGRRWACWLLGHQVGVARVEPLRLVRGGAPEPVRTSRCVHCNRAFTDVSEDSEAA
jgi:hypothetical protein